MSAADDGPPPPPTANSDDLNLLWSRIELEVRLPSASACASSTEIRGVARLWVLPHRTGARSVRLHCRQCAVSSVAVNGAPVAWELLDPYHRIVHDEELAGNGEAYGVFQRAAMLAAHDGELLVGLPDEQKGFFFPDTLWASAHGTAQDDAHLGHAARSRALVEMKAGIPNAAAVAGKVPTAVPYVIEVS